PVPALLLAGVYQGWHGLTGLSARTRPDLFAYGMTLASSGLAYVVAVWCVFALGGVLRLPLAPRLLLAASFALATVSLTYARHVNNHILLLGVASGVMLLLARLPNERPGRAWGCLLLLGTLAGMGYTIDLGTGPVLLACTLTVVAWRCLLPPLSPRGRGGQPAFCRALPSSRRARRGWCCLPPANTPPAGPSAPATPSPALSPGPRP